ncbi:leucine--tRNA ligase [Candidatus Poribacteria bacterium]|nr:MAG: leucine--tRNA ligase [Candidatus Poribacteria bacterium]
MSREGYPFEEIETKWQRFWEERKLFKVTEDDGRPKYYLLEMFPYPSGRIHMGHVRNYTIGDVLARYRMMQGYNVLHPMGWDAFGLPAENAAIQHGVHPATWTRNNIEYMRKQLKRMGFSYDWDREISTCSPEYYRWNQWLFLKMYERGLAYRKEAAANWCESCQTVLANEEVVNGRCWRCDSPVVQRSLMQWFLRITAYAEELLRDLDKLEGWPERVIIMQRNWIGRSEGAEIDFPVAGSNEVITVFTTRPDTVYGATYMVLAPEHPMVKKLVRGTDREAEVMRFVEEVTKRTKIERTAEMGEKRGIFTGAYCINPMTGEKIPIWIADYVLMEYGTGAIMAVPAHDQRDFEFAKRYNLPIRIVIQKPDYSLDPETMEEAYEEPGVMVNSGEFSGLDSETGKQRIVEYMESKGIGRRSVQYKLRDWCISRQRYWGTPIPIIYCDSCGTVPVPYEDLPVLLPEDVEYKGSGTATLVSCKEFYEVKCPRCGRLAHRETDTMSTFVDSSWYFLRYVDPRNEEEPFSKGTVGYWMPVEQYIGGIEHAVLHLLYARFITKVMRDLGLIDFDEPFTNLLTQGMVVKDGAKMSKSKGNVVDPDDMIKKYGCDTVRVFMMFAAPPERDLEWSDRGIEGSYRFLNRVWDLVHELMDEIKDVKPEYDPSGLSKPARELRRMVHRTIKRVTTDIEERMHFNTAISAIMELVNFMYGMERSDEPAFKAVLREGVESLILLLSPFAPHICEELWERIGNEPGLVRHPWPKWDESALVEEEMLIVVQVNGKVRGRVTVPADASEEEVKRAAMEHHNVKRYIEGKTPKRVIYVPKKLINIVV